MVYRIIGVLIIVLAIYMKLQPQSWIGFIILSIIGLVMIIIPLINKKIN
ncbi:hypothetical protein ACFL5D_01880 [Candidatus Neomarinimicrobiota bacterium]